MDKGNLVEFIAGLLILAIYFGILMAARYLGKKRVRATIFFSAGLLFISVTLLEGLGSVFQSIHYHSDFFLMFVLLYTIFSFTGFILLILLLIFAYLAVWFGGKDQNDNTENEDETQTQN